MNKTLKKLVEQLDVEITALAVIAIANTIRAIQNATLTNIYAAVLMMMCCITRVLYKNNLISYKLRKVISAILMIDLIGFVILVFMN